MGQSCDTAGSLGFQVWNFTDLCRKLKVFSDGLSPETKTGGDCCKLPLKSIKEEEAIASIAAAVSSKSDVMSRLRRSRHQRPFLWCHDVHFFFFFYYFLFKMKSRWIRVRILVIQLWSAECSEDIVPITSLSEPRPCFGPSLTPAPCVTAAEQPEVDCGPLTPSWFLSERPPSPCCVYIYVSIDYYCSRAQ